MSANDDLLSPRLTGAEYFARVNALDQKAALLSVWADLFTDNCSEQGADELYAHYTTFAGLFSGHRGGQALPFGSFRRSWAKTRRWVFMMARTPISLSTGWPSRTAISTRDEVPDVRE